jgi:succinyl-CoA synthetase beta subunit
MNLMEYQGKELFKRVGIPVPRSQHCNTPDEAAKFVAEHPGEWVIKAQVLMGGRGKAGKIKMAANADEARERAAEIMATPMPPNRQNPNGEPINSILVEERLDIAKEAYCAIAIDRTSKRPMVMVSKFGGMDIEEVADEHPDSIARALVDTAGGYWPYVGRDLAFASGLDPGYRKALPAILAGVYDLFFTYGAKLVEINPLALTKDGRVIASDAKVELDDDALFKHAEFKQWQ